MVAYEETDNSPSQTRKKKKVYSGEMWNMSNYYHRSHYYYHHDNPYL